MPGVAGGLSALGWREGESGGGDGGGGEIDGGGDGGEGYGGDGGGGGGGSEGGVGCGGGATVSESLRPESGRKSAIEMRVVFEDATSPARPAVSVVAVRPAARRSTMERM